MLSESEVKICNVEVANMSKFLVLSREHFPGVIVCYECSVLGLGKRDNLSFPV